MKFLDIWILIVQHKLPHLMAVILLHNVFKSQEN